MTELEIHWVSFCITMFLTDINRNAEVFILGKIRNSKQNCTDRDPKIGGKKNFGLRKASCFLLEL